MSRKIAILFAIFLVFITVFVAILTTPVGFDMSLWLAKKTLPGTLTYHNADGLLIGPMNIEQLEYKNQAITVAVDNLKINWSLFDFVFGKIHFEQLQANRVDITLHPTINKPNEPRGNLWLPSKLKISELNIRSLNFNNQYVIYGWRAKELRFNKNSLIGSTSLELIKPYPLIIHYDATGSHSNYQVKLSLKNRDIDGKLFGTGSDHSLKLMSDDSKTLGGNFTAKINVNWATQLSWDANINAHAIELAKITTKIPQKINLSLNTQGTWDYRQLPLFKINAILDSATTRITVVGQHQHNWDLSWNITIPHLEHWWPALQGAITSNGTLTGQSANPTISGSLKATTVAGYGYSIRQLQATGRLDLSYATASHIQLHANNIVTPYTFLKALDVDAVGNPHSHVIKAKVHAENKFLGNSHLLVDWSGNNSKGLWTFNFKDFTLSSQHLGHWTLNNGTQLQFDNTHIAITPMCWQSKKGKACFKGGWNHDKPWSFDLNWQGIDLTPLFEHLRPGLSMRGSANLDIHANGNGTKIENGAFNLALHNSKLHYNGDNGVTELNFAVAKLEANLAEGKLNSQLQLLLKNGDHITSNINLPNVNSSNFRADQQHISGKIDINLTRLKILNLFIPDIFNPSGKLIGHMNLNGTLAKPTLTGNINLIGGKLEITEAKVNLTHMNASISASGDHIRYHISAKSENEPINIEGNTNFTQTGFPTVLRIKANNVLLMNTVEYQIYASPDLTFKIHGREARLTGSVLIPKAMISPIAFNSIVTLPQDTTIIGYETEESEPLIFESDVHIKLGDQVMVNTSGLKGQLAGGLTIKRKNHQTILASGQLNLINSTFTTHGTTLTISPGSGVTYTNTPITEPALNVKATKTISVNPTTTGQTFSPNSVTVGVQIAGTLRHPIWSLFAVPNTLSQADILSYLLFGRPSNSNSPGNITLLLQAISTLHLNEGNSPDNPASQISQSLGLTEFGVEQTTSIDAFGTPIGGDQSSFVIGRYLSPKIYLRYSRGLLTPINIFQVRYLLGKNWALQMEASTLGSGGDVLYTIQRP